MTKMVGKNASTNGKKDGKDANGVNNDGGNYRVENPMGPEHRMERMQKGATMIGVMGPRHLMGRPRHPMGRRNRLGEMRIRARRVVRA